MKIQKNEKRKERITYIDTAKCLVILFMILGHIIIYFRGLGNDHPQLLIFIHSFHMPAFFIFSGLFFKKEKILKQSFFNYIILKIKSLIIPYLFLDISGGIINSIIKKKLSLKIIIEIIKKTFSLNPNMGANWFLLSLFIGSIILYFIIKYYKKWFNYFIILAVLLFSFHRIGIEYDKITLTIFLLRGVIGFIFMYLGYSLKNYYFDDYNKRIDIIIVTSILLAVIMDINGQIDIWSCTINNPIYMILGGIIGTFLIIGISKNIDNQFFQFIGRNTITIMGTHYILIENLYKILKLGIGDKSFIILFISVLLIEIPWIYLYEKYIPFLIGKSKNK